MPTPRSIACATLLLAAAALPAAAQRRSTPTLSLEGGGVYAAYRGDGFRNTNDGPGFAVQGNLGVSLFALGVGYVRTEHDVAGSDDDAVVSGVFVEPRLALPIAYGNFTPYLLGRVAWLDQTVGTGAGRVESTATALGGGAGLLLWIAPGVQINTSATYYGMRLTGDEDDAGRERRGGSGVDLRLGLSLGATGWGQQ
jgi:hypothetical protein